MSAKVAEKNYVELQVHRGENSTKRPWLEWLIDTDLGAYYPQIYVYDGYAVKERLKELGFVWEPSKARWAWMQTMHSMYEAEIFIDAMLARLNEAGVRI